MTRSTCTLSLMLALGAACGDKEDEAGADTGATDTSVDADGDGVNADEDCDDDDPSVFPGADEACNGLDDDCDGDTDEGVTGVFWDDADGDGYGDPSTRTEACTADDEQVENGDDCDDDAPTIHPAASEACNNVDDDCDGDIDEDVVYAWYLDADADGFGDAGAEWSGCAPPPGYVDDDTDCDDRDGGSYPGAPEVCDEADNDCDDDIDEGVTTTFYADGDGDGFGEDDDTIEACAVPVGYAAAAGDCDDVNIDAAPDRSEQCNGFDDDCDGDTDEDDADDAPTWYADGDGDGYGAGTGQAACAAPSGTVNNADDCDDTAADVNPDTVWYLDYDSDGYGGTRLTQTQCAQPSGFVRDDTDCDDLDDAVNPDATEVCNDADDDCDGDIDDDDATLDTSTATTWYADTDSDGYGDSAVSTLACDAPSGTVADDTDCDDTEAAAYTGATEACDGIDNDCDGSIDEGVLGVDSACAAVSCDEIFADDPSAADGAYYLDPDSNGAFLNYCDMSNDGGGWTLVFSCDADDATYGSGFDGWWQDGDTETLDDTLDRGKSVAYDEADVDEVRLTATYPDDSTVIFTTASTLDDLHDIVGAEITTCSGLTGTGRYTYTASTYLGSYWQSSTVAVVVCDTDGSSLETTSAGNYDAAIFSTYTNHGDYNGPNGNIGSEFTCGGGQSSYGISSNTLSVWVR